MRRILTFLVTLAAVMALSAQTMNVRLGQVVYQIPADQAGEILISDGTLLTVLERPFAISDITEIYIDKTEVTDNTVQVDYDGATATVYVAGNIARYVSATVSGAHVSIEQDASVDDSVGEITYTLSGSSDDGEFYMEGSYKATVELNGLTLTNQTPVYSGAAVCIMDGKRIDLSVKKDTQNSLTDCATGDQKAALYCKGHLELKGHGTLTVSGLAAHGMKSAEYMTMKNCTVIVDKAAKDGISCDEYFLMESGSLTIGNTGDDALQCDIDGTATTGATDGHDGEDSGNIYLLGGTLTLNVTADAAKGLKAGGDVVMQGGEVAITQTGSIIAGTDLSYPTSIKATGDITISGGTLTINNTADGGKGLSADGDITIDESSATTVVDITANGKGGTAETTGSTDEGDEEKSYVVYVSLPTQGGGGMGPGGNSAWTRLYLYKSDGTLVQQLTSTVTKSSGYSTTTFYYYDFGQSDAGTYYFKSDNYTSRGGGGTYAIQSTTFSGPTSGTDYYYSISNSYTTSGSTRTYQLSNVTNTYGGSSDVSEDNGTGYNAMGIKADGKLTIAAGTVKVGNSGSMSKSLKSKTEVVISGGDITLTPSGQMQVINNDASYSSAVKTKDFSMNGGTLTINASGQAGRGITATNITTSGGTISITNTGAGVTGTSDNYTAKGMKADTSIRLLAGTITISMSGTGGKGIKSAGTYTQGSPDGSGPTLTVSTTGASLGSTGGGWGGGGWGQQSGGSSAKAIKVQGTATLYGGTTEVTTKTSGAEGLESKTSVRIEGGQHYLFCYDDCINSSGAIYFNGGATVCYSNGNDAVDSNYGRSGAVTIGDGAVLAYTSRGAPEEGLDCDNNSYIQITGTGYAITAGGAQGGGSSASTISNASQGYRFVTSTIGYQTGRYYTLSDATGQNLITYSLAANVSSTLSLFTAKGMVKGGSYQLKYSTTAPTDATTAWHGIYLGSSATGTTSVTTITAQ